MNTHKRIGWMLIVLSCVCTTVGCGESAEEKKKKELAVVNAVLAEEEKRKREDACHSFERGLRLLREAEGSDNIIRFIHDGVEISLKKVSPRKEEVKKDNARVGVKSPSEIFDQNLQQIRVADRVGMIKFSTDDNIEVTLVRKKDEKLLDLQSVSVLATPAVMESPPAHVHVVQEVVPKTPVRNFVHPPALPHESVVVTVTKDGKLLNVKEVVVDGAGRPATQVLYGFIFNDVAVIDGPIVIERIEVDGEMVKFYVPGSSVPGITNAKYFYVSPVRPQHCPNCPPERR